MRIFCILFLLASALRGFGQDTTGYYRYPAIHGETIVFTSEGDLWRVSTRGGEATRLTSHAGEELMAAFSPDGQTIAFSASYEGPREVYTMRANGGLPTRRTFEGSQANVIGWTPSGKILYATDRYSSLPSDLQLLTIDKQNRIARIELAQASDGSYDPSEHVLFFTRLGRQPSFTKRYEGGSAQNIWKYDGGGEATPLTADYAGTSKNAMWWKGRIYFLSDRDGIMNLWSMDENGKRLTQLTKSRDFDLESASLSDGRIAYQEAGALHVYDVATGREDSVPVHLPSDFDNLREHWIKNPIEYATSIHLSPDGNDVVLTARGRAFVAPAKAGRFVDLPSHSSARFREARMMPNGKSVLVLSTESGEGELWRYPSNGDGPAEQLTKSGKVLRWEGIPSPDGKFVAHQDKDQQLWLLDTASKADKRIAEANTGDVDQPSFADLRWSPDSKWLTYTEDAPNDFSRIVLYSVQTGASTMVTTDRYNSGAASWSPDGKWLYFLSDRSLKTAVLAPWGARIPEPYFYKKEEMYAVSLKAGVPSLFEPEDELHPAPEPAKADATANTPGGSKSKEPAPISIDTDGLANRIQSLPLPAGNFSDLSVVGGRLCWIAHDPESAGDARDALQCVEISNKPNNKPETLLEGVRQFEATPDGKKILIRRQNDLYVLDGKVSEAALKDPKTLADAQIDLKSWTFSVIPAQEFREEFLDAWRLHRDYFYDPNMHNVGWVAMRDKYLPLVARVRDRQELSEVLAQMVGELSALHTFVRGGDLRKGADQIAVASLGAAFTRDEAAGGFRVEHIYRTDPDQPGKLSPLLKQGVTIQEGDVVTAINGQPALGTVEIGDTLRDQVGKQVLLDYRVKGRQDLQHAIVRVISTREEADLRYSEWEYGRRLAVEKASDRHIGYVHLRAMGPADIAQWVENYTPIYNRDGLIVDVRHNRGGNIDSWVLDSLSRKAWMYWQARRGRPMWNMQGAFRGHIVVLCDQMTASDGEAFTEGFRRLGLGKVIGTRTWGGEIWLSSSNVLADNGIASAAEMGVFGPERKWLIEGHGVDPDMMVDNLPHAAFEGRDAQLEAALSYLSDEIKRNPNPVPEPPPYPDKSQKTWDRARKQSSKQSN